MPSKAAETGTTSNRISKQQRSANKQQKQQDQQEKLRKRKLNFSSLEKANNLDITNVEVV